MKRSILGACGLAVAIAVASPTQAVAQEGYPLAPIPARGLSVSPFFEGWYQNPDGTYTLSFGYFNANAEEVLDVPLGPDNRIEPAEFDGMQPTHFPPVNYGGFNARRERGVFAITVPADFAGKDIWWSITSNGKTDRIPGRVTSEAYQLSLTPMAMGSYPPTVRFSEGGPTGSGPAGVTLDRTLVANVGVPVQIELWASDERSVRASPPVALGVTWNKHQGPGSVTFSQRTGSIPVEGEGKSSVMATFDTPGEYMLRARVDNHRAPDSTPADQCCWTNGYVRVNVRP